MTLASRFSDISGLLGFDTSLGGDGNGITMPDWDRKIIFTTSASSGVCAVWDLTAVDTPPNRLHYHATNGGDFFSVGGFDSAGYWYTSKINGFGFTVNKISPDLQTQTVVNFNSPLVATPNSWMFTQLGDKDYLISASGAEVDMINATDMTYVGRVPITVEPVCAHMGRISASEMWAIGCYKAPTGSFNHQAGPFGLHHVHLQPDNVTTPLTVTRVWDIAPALFGWTHFSSVCDLLGDETDGNPIIFSNSVALAAYNPATTYAQFGVASFGTHDYESLADGNTGHQPDISPANWRDLGLSVADEAAFIKVNAATGATMWKISCPGGSVNGFREMTRVRHGKYRVIDPSSVGGGIHKVHDVDTITGVENLREVWNVIPNFQKQFYDDTQGRYMAALNYGYVSTEPRSPVPIGATSGSYGGLAELGPNPWVEPPAGLLAFQTKQMQVFG